MTLNKSTGLYSVPAHHLYGAQSAPRPSFNSMDFVDSPERSKSKRGPGWPLTSDGVAAKAWAKKGKKWRKSNVKQTDEGAATSTPVIGGKKNKGKKKSPAHVAKNDARETSASTTPASTKSKKRKRGVEAHAPRRRVSTSFVSADMLQNVQSSIRAAREVFSSPAAVQRKIEPSSEEVKPSSRKARKTGRRSTDTLDFDLMAKETRRIARKVKELPTSVSSQPRKTAVPLPLNAFSHAANASKAKRIGSREPRRVLGGTPEGVEEALVGLVDSPIPFKLSAMKTKQQKVVGHSAFTPVLENKSKPPSSRASLTTSNLLHYTTTTQPLSDAPKPRPRAASTADSSTSAGTTPSIASLFLRVGKPYSRSGAETDPFTAHEAPKKHARRETHDEANAATFTSLFTAVQNAVNFSDERDYHTAFTAWRRKQARAKPLPCLGLKASGCSARKEAQLREDRESGVSGADAAMLAHAAQQGSAAEALLARCVQLRVPVPLGAIEGLWKLVCPAYAAAHADRYGGGQRVLSVFSVPCAGGGDEAATHTARLSIPPRSMAYGLSGFVAPPHAGFRATVVRTGEGYRVEVFFLGGGVAVVRVDLGLLLCGKGEGVMEFVGVRVGEVR